jgi:hypothetical protein
MVAELAAMGALSGISSAINTATQKEMMKQSQKYYEQNAAKAYERQRQLARDNYSLAAQSMRDAGMSPTALNPNQSVPSVPSAPMPTPLEGGKLDLLGSAGAAANLRLVDAQSDLLKAQADKEKIEVQHMESRDVVSDVTLRDYLQRVVDNKDGSYDKAYVEYCKSVLENTPNGFDFGSVQGLADYFKMSDSQSDNFWKKFDNSYKVEMIKAYRQHNVPEWMAKLPEKQFEELAEKIGNIQASTILLASESALNSDKSKHLQSEISKNLQEIQHLYHGDPAAMWDNSDYEALFIGLTAKVIPAAIQAAIFKRGISSVSKTGVGTFTGAAGGEVKTTLGRKLDALANVPPMVASRNAGLKAMMRDEASKRTFEALTQRKGADAANAIAARWIGSKFRYKYETFDKWLSVGEMNHR